MQAVFSFLARSLAWLVLSLGLVLVTSHSLTQKDGPDKTDEPALHAGFGEADITPRLGGNDVFIAGFGQNRKADKINDPLKVRAVVLKHGDRKIALASLDLVGHSHESTERIRKKLPGFTYVLVQCTHNHHGPDTIGIWGSNPFKSGVDPDYLARIEEETVNAVRAADKACRPVTARIGTAAAPELLHDGRAPIVKHDELVAILFSEPGKEKAAGVIVQWNCHPETLAPKNTAVSADFVGVTVKHLAQRHGCPALYLTGTVGGLMTSMHLDIRDEKGEKLKEGSVEKMERYGHLVGELADRALAKAQPVRLTPLEARSRIVFLPLDNKLYVAGWKLGVLKRDAFLWSGDPTKAEKAPEKPAADQRLATRSEVALLRLGELDVACIPGEIYPELVLDRVQDPADAGADFPKAPVEPAVYKQLRGPHRMLIGLANDELGYIIPKRQWDEQPPFCYGRDKAQYGEANSLGPDTAPLLCKALAELAAGRK